MKKLFFILCLGVLALTDVAAQQIPLYSQYWYNPFVYNPAQTGFNERPQLFFIYRRQFADFDEAPETRAATFDMPVWSKKAGIGFTVFNDRASIFNRYGGSANYAYHINFSDEHRLSIGIGAGVQQIRINFSDVFVLDPTDDIITANRTNSAFFSGSAGVHYYLKGWSLGLSAPQVFATDLDFASPDGITGYELQRHYLARTSYKLRLIDKKFTIEPMVSFRTTESFNWQLDGGASFMWKDFVWLNAMYRYDYAVTIGGGFKVHDMVSVGYAYDLALNEIADYTTGSHEIMLGLHFRDRKKGADEDTSAIEDSTIMKKFAEQDSLIADLQAQIDSLDKRVDSLEAIFEAGLEVEGLDELMDSMMNVIDSLRTQVSKNTEWQNEMQEERTRIVDEKDLEYKRGAELGDYFMVVGSFRIEQNSYNFQDQLTSEGYRAGVVFDKKRKWYYVYLSQPENWEKGLEELYRLREENERFHDAWIHIMSGTMR